MLFVKIKYKEFYFRVGQTTNGLTGIIIGSRRFPLITATSLGMCLTYRSIEIRMTTQIEIHMTTQIEIHYDNTKSLFNVYLLTYGEIFFRLILLQMSSIILELWIWFFLFFYLAFIHNLYHFMKWKKYYSEPFSILNNILWLMRFWVLLRQM